MDYEIVRLEEKKVAGISARTNNSSPDAGAVIGGLWETFYQAGIYGSIENKANAKALCIYTDYAGDEKGDYTALVACEVGGTEPGSLPAGVTVQTVPAGKYAKFVVHGDMVKAVQEFWQQLWMMDLPRLFSCDFEEYQDGSMDQAEIHMYISLKE